VSRIEKYRECAARGMSVGDTARLYGVTLHAVRWANKKHNLGFGLRQTKKGRDLIATRERVSNLVAEGKTRREIAFIMKKPIATVVSWCRRWKLTNPNWTGGRAPLMAMLEPHLTPKEADELRFLRTKGYTFKDALPAIKRPDLLEGLK
jgi:hypothetical protein